MRKQLSLALASLLLVSACQKAPEPLASSPTPQATATEAVAPDSEQSLTATAVLGDLSAERPVEITLVEDHSGQANSAFSFPGEGAGLSAPVNINPDVMPQCTLVTWARYTGEPDAGSTQQVVSHDDGDYDRSVGLDARAGEWGWTCFAGNQGAVGGFPVEPGQWIFLAAIYDQTAKTLVFYAGQDKLVVNDVELGQGLETTSVGTNPSYGEFFKGDIEPVKVFDRVLTEEEIQALRAL